MKNLAICLESNQYGFKEGCIYNVTEVDKWTGIRVSDGKQSANFQLGDKHFCFILNATDEIADMIEFLST